jgi:hypothetical protein
MLEYAFHISSAGTLHSLPIPVPRRNQKLAKPEYFDVLQRTQNAKGEAAAARMWFFGRHREWLYPQVAIETEFASVIACGVVSCGKHCFFLLIVISLSSPLEDGVAHEAFTSFPEITRPREQTTSGIGGYPDLDMMNNNQFGPTTTSHIDTDKQKGWLSDDGIDEW